MRLYEAFEILKFTSWLRSSSPMVFRARRVLVNLKLCASVNLHFTSNYVVFHKVEMTTRRAYCSSANPCNSAPNHRIFLPFMPFHPPLVIRGSDTLLNASMKLPCHYWQYNGLEMILSKLTARLIISATSHVESRKHLGFCGPFNGHCGSPCKCDTKD